MKKDNYIDDEDKRLQDSIENDEWLPSKNKKEIKSKLLNATSNYFKKNKQMSIRISEHDLINIKQKALLEGIPYQTLVGSVLHKYSEGRLKEVDK